MKKIVTLSLASLLAAPTLTYTQNINTTTGEDTVILESPILHYIDGIIINADVIQQIALIVREINKILIGEKVADGSIIGRYAIGNKVYSVKELATLEENASESLQKELLPLLDAAKKDLQASVEPFIDIIHNFKHQLLELIKESCKKRGMDTTILLRWSEAGAGEETKIFNEDVRSFTLYYRFCTDLLNFLDDLVHSCPKGWAQFKIRCDKCQKARTLIKEIVTTRSSTPATSNALSQKFMRHLTEHHIDKLTMSEITREKLETLFNKFVNQKN